MTLLQRATIVLFAAALAGGCATTRKAYYNTWEKFGYAKRERLVDNVKAARQEQVDAKKQFASALEQFKSVVNFNGGDLEKLYNRLDKEYQRSDAEAGRVRDKIQSVKNVATALFTEWQDEIGQMSDASLRQKSRALLDRTRGSYQEMIQRMDVAAGTMDPVLSRFKDHVLFIKHNLNAQAIASLKGTELDLGRDIDRLIREMEASIAEADAFIAEVQGKQK
jgi:Skp family chaperone for outer membrane proteins